jgi:hypothetical protein
VPAKERERVYAAARAAYEKAREAGKLRIE